MGNEKRTYNDKKHDGRTGGSRLRQSIYILSGYGGLFGTAGRLPAPSLPAVRVLATPHETKRGTNAGIYNPRLVPRSENKKSRSSACGLHHFGYVGGHSAEPGCRMPRPAARGTSWHSLEHCVLGHEPAYGLE